jgi:hypothetical protein
MRDLALSGMTQQAIADKYGVTQGAVSQFKDKHAEAIAEIAAAADDEYAGIWIAQKQNRLEALAEIAEIAMQPTPKITTKGTVVFHPETGDLVSEVDGRLAAQVMKQAAEEMGQLPTRLQVSGDMNTTTTYRVESVNVEDLK